MRYFRAQVSLAYDSVLPRDVSVNVWHFEDETPPVGPDLAIAAIHERLQSFYEAIASEFSENLSTTGHRIKVYDLMAAPPRSPVADEPFDLPTVGAGALPNEVAVCLSYRGAFLSGTNRRRNTGRIYLGPLRGGASEDATGDVRVLTSVRNTIVTAVETHFWPAFASPPPGSTLRWSVFSRSDALGLAVGQPAPAEEPHYTAVQLEAGFKPIVLAWVDDAFDTQRRRGLAPSTRTLTI